MTFEDWANGYGVIRHTPETRARVRGLATRLVSDGRARSEADVFAVLAAADRLTSAVMWTVVHMTYADRVDLSGAPLPAEAFKVAPEGHTGGALNVAPAYVGYLAANVLSATTRAWILGQGHCVAAVEAANALVDNLSAAQQGRYGAHEEGLSRLCADFYSYAIGSDGRPSAPLGSHVNPHTAGGISEGGYLGFAEIQYAHMPLPGERLVAILSDGAFEEQRGSDWSERWWRGEDCGLVAPMMVLNGRRIEQRTEVAQDGGAAWLGRHLDVNGFDPITIDGRDPAAYAWAVLESEARLSLAGAERIAGRADYPVRLPFIIASTVKGFGFPGAGTNAAHNLPLGAVPRTDASGRAAFHAAAAALHVSPGMLSAAREAFLGHAAQGRPKERDHALAHRNPAAPVVPASQAPSQGAASAMAAMDAWFVDFVQANPGHRFRVGNPDELSSNQMGRTLERLKHRVNSPEAGAPESVTGAVITALNEEAVIGAALGNKGGLNLAVSYEAFAVKMLGALRQDIIFARQQVEAGRPPQWIGMPLVVTSHTWENGKNQQSHQDPTIGEALLGEMSDVSRVLFPVDAATAVEALRTIYADRGVVACIVASKRPTACVFQPKAAHAAMGCGAAEVEADPDAELQLVAVGAYQLAEARRAAERLRARGRRTSVACILEPGRLRAPRDEYEARFVMGDTELKALFPEGLPRVLISHTRPEPLLGVLRRIDGGPARLRAHGYVSRGGTLDIAGMQFANRCTWAHLVASAAEVLGLRLEELLDAPEQDAVLGRGSPAVLR
ncbi:xylulose 5-phosphate 3-epimerase [Phenylobacterium kunshanense]|uniref:Xylulose 5-phosphate 3-epimerase n=1 Tax=Phenylobacterium kunshanense TaxID=1445034 RepID=A0A328BMX5_9CAUL|nr:xylulose 5-phosphate 3-epimerase [Phenylobacterium kunshanense]RAK68742.1 xylulose 5-phosphate 3-epimerase [Phenylobacterium kunshanense]